MGKHELVASTGIESTETTIILAVISVAYIEFCILFIS